jgi:hypothetical protein
MNVAVGSTQSTVQRSNINAGAAGIRLTANDKQLGKQSNKSQPNLQGISQMFCYKTHSGYHHNLLEC